MKEILCKYKKGIALMLAGILLLGASVPKAAAKAGQQREAGGEGAAASGDQKEACSEGIKAAPSSALGEKSETVYVKAGADGAVKEITVEALLKNTEEGSTLEDYSGLKDIKNKKGDEEFTQRENGTLVWENHGEDISYEGKRCSQLPVSVKISYYLNGQKISPKSLAGKSGQLRIRFDYENHTLESVKADGKEREVQIPFTVLSLLFLDSDRFSNIEVTNGKLMESEGNNIVMGYACPGLEDSLKLGNYEVTEDIGIPDYVEITADVTEFELEFTATVVTNGMFADVDLADLDDAKELADSMKELQDASTELVDGVKELWEGTGEFGGYLDEYTDGVSKADEGARLLKEGMETLNEKKTDLETGAAAIQTGLEGLNKALAEVTLPEDGSMDALAGAAAALASDAASLSEGLAGMQEGFHGMQSFASDAKAYQSGVESKAAEAKNNLSSVSLSEVEAKANETARNQVRSVLDTALADPDLSEEARAQLEQIAEEASDSFIPEAAS